MSSKKEAERTENRLLQTFDYAWNKRGNGARRREDIPVKLDAAVSKNVRITKVLGFFNDFKFGKQQAGIRISGTVPAEDPPKRFPSSHADPQAKLVPSVFKFSKSRPQLVLGGFFANEDPSICGQILSDGSVCMNKPVQGSKCCGKHEKRVNATVPKFMVDKEYTPNAITDGSQYMEHPAFGPKGRELHGRRITTSSSPMLIGTEKSRSVNPQFTWDQWIDIKYDSICGVITSDGCVCRNKPVKNRKRCSAHKGQRISGSHSRSVEVEEGPIKDTKVGICGTSLEDGRICLESPEYGRERLVLDKGWTAPLLDGEHTGQRISGSPFRSGIAEEGPARDTKMGICGASLQNGGICSRSPVYGRKRCALHKGRRAPLLDGEHTGEMISESPVWSGIAEESPARDTKMGICGASLQNGGICSKSPVYGRKRCALHKGRRAPLLDGEYAGQRISELPFWSGKGEDSPATDTKMGICGASLPNGGICSRSPVHGRKRCALHKGRRAPLLYDL